MHGSTGINLFGFWRLSLLLITFAFLVLFGCLFFCSLLSSAMGICSTPANCLSRGSSSKSSACSRLVRVASLRRERTQYASVSSPYYGLKGIATSFTAGGLARVFCSSGPTTLKPRDVKHRHPAKVLLSVDLSTFASFRTVSLHYAHHLPHSPN